MPKLPTERAWAKSEILEPQLVPREPALISDGGGLAFPPTALAGTAPSLDRQDPAVVALIDQIILVRGGRSVLRHRAPSDQERGAVSLAGWRELARTENQVLFGGGRPPDHLTAAVRREAKRGTYECVAVSRGKPLRAAREGARASSFRPDPDRPPTPGDTEIRLLVLEQSRAGGKRATGRFLAPDLHLDPAIVLLRVYITPRDGFQMASPNPETPVRIRLPEPLGERELVDGAIYWAPAPGPEST